MGTRTRQPGPTLKRPTWLGDGSFISLPGVLLHHPSCKPSHLRLYAVLANRADFSTGAVKIGPVTLAKLARVSFHSIRGYPRKRVRGLIPDLCSWGFISEVQTNGRVLNLRLLPAPRTRDGQLSFEVADARSQVADARSQVADARSPSSYYRLSSDLSEGAEPDGSLGTSATINSPTPTTHGHWAVQLFVDEYRKVAGRDPLSDHKKIVGRHAKALENEGRPRSLIEALIRRIVTEGKSPGILPALVLEQELSAAASRNGHGSHRGFQGYKPEDFSGRNLEFRPLDSR